MKYIKKTHEPHSTKHLENLFSSSTFNTLSKFITLYSSLVPVQHKVANDQKSKENQDHTDLQEG